MGRVMFTAHDGGRLGSAIGGAIRGAMTESRTMEADPARFGRHLGRGVPFPAWGSKKAHTWSTHGGHAEPRNGAGAHPSLPSGLGIR